MLLVRIIENNKRMLILGQVQKRLAFPGKIRKGIRIGPRRLEPPARARNTKNFLQNNFNNHIFSIEPRNAPDPILYICLSDHVRQ